MRLLTAAQMREHDRQAIEEIGLPGALLMENAGRAAAAVLQQRFADCFPGPVLVLAGKGNNGGDGYVLARTLQAAGWQLRTLVLATADAISGDAALHLQALARCGGEVQFVAEESALETHLARQTGVRVVVDALLGTGLTSAVQGLYARAIDWLNAGGAPILALDIPSGVDASSGQILGRAVRATVTVSFAAAKLGQLLYPGASCCGNLEVVDIGLPPAPPLPAAERHSLVDAQLAAALLPSRPVTGHKGTFGHLLVVGGCRGKSGALALSAAGGLRSGAGLITAAGPASLQPVLAQQLLEVMTAPLAEVDGHLSLQALPALQQLWQDKASLALGPGLGESAEARALARRLLVDCPLPLVLDADGLNALQGQPELLLQRSGRATVLTPHPGEMARLCGLSIAEVEADRIGAARSFADRHQVVLVLKGARSLIATPEGEIFVNSSGNPGLASGGSGDVLTGLIGGLLAQGLTATAAAVLGVYLHGLAAERLSRQQGEAGLAASDLARELPAARHELTQQGASHA